MLSSISECMLGHVTRCITSSDKMDGSGKLTSVTIESHSNATASIAASNS